MSLLSNPYSPRFLICLLSGVIAWGAHSQSAIPNDIEILKTNLIRDAVESYGFADRTRRFATTDFSQASHYLDSLEADGRWADVDYSDTDNDWSPILHLDRMLVLTIAYAQPSSELHNSHRLLRKIELSLQYWYAAAPTCVNWYKNDIGKQFFLQQIGLLIGQQIDPALYSKIIDDLTERPSMGGVNMTWLAVSTLYRGVLEKNHDRIQIAVDGIKQQIAFEEKYEGLKPDYSYQQHGRHLYNGMYGTNFLSDSARIGSILRGTRYALSTEQVELLRSYYFESMQWMLRGKLQDYNVRGRQVGRTAGADLQGYELLKPLQYMAALDPEYKDRYLASMRAIKNGEPQDLIGNRHFWWADFTVHHRSAYMASLKMCSERTLGTEIDVNSENLLGYWLPFGLTYLYQQGDEYDGIFPAWDWGRLPGVTQPHEEFAIKKGRYTQQTEFVGGVSDGLYGVSAMQLSIQQTEAKKAWFWFDDAWVALGADINSSHSAPIVTGVNQTLLSGPVILNGQALSSSSHTFQTPSRVLHDKVGYIFPNHQKVQIKAQSQDGRLQRIFGLADDIIITKEVFSLWFDHGYNPENASYEYIVVPDTNASELERFHNSPHIQTLANNAQLQAVHHSELQLTGLVFWEAGSCSLPSGITISVSAPSILLINEDHDTLHISDPTQKLHSIEITLKKTGSQTIHHTITLPAGPNTGKSLRIDDLRSTL